MRRGIPCMERIPTLIRPLELTLRVGSRTRVIIAAFGGGSFRRGGGCFLGQTQKLTLRVGSQARTIISAFCGSCFRQGAAVGGITPTFGTNASRWFAPKDKGKNTRRCSFLYLLERKTGLEPATFGLGSRRSTIEPLPHGLRIVYNFLLGLSIERRQNGHKKEKRRPELQPDDVFMV